MAQVVEVVLKHGACEGPNLRTNGSRTYRDTYTVRTDLPIDDGNIVLGQAVAFAGGVPNLGIPFRTDPGALCAGYSPKQNSDARVVWEIGVTYDSNTSPGDSENPAPWDKPTRWSWGAERIEEAWFWDLDGKAFLNSAGDRFNPPPMIPRSNPVLVIEQNRLDYDAVIATAWGDSVNSAPVWGFPKHTIKMAFPTADEEHAEGESYWKITYEFEIIVNEPLNLNPDDPKWRGWHPIKLLNLGPRFKDDNGKLVLASDDNNVVGGQEVFLDHDGGQVENPTPTNVMQYRKAFRTFRLKDFATLSL